MLRKKPEEFFIGFFLDKELFRKGTNFYARGRKENLMLKNILIFFIMFCLTLLPNHSLAQDDNIWSTPINVSLSGSSSNPSFVVDLKGNTHIFWLDEFDDLMYARFDGTNWSIPQPVNLPSNIYIPKLLIGSNNQIHAFWIDDEGNLFYRWTNSDNLSIPGVWSNPVIISDGVAAFDAFIDSDGNVHLAYALTIETNNRPAGVYYRKTNSNANTWQQPIKIYTSRYFRVLDSDSANVQISVSNSNGEAHVFLAWENRPLKALFFARSLNGGNDWEPPTEIVSQATRPNPTTPYNVRIAILSEQILVVYQDGQPGFSCSQSYQHSEDNGANWSEPRRMLEEVPGCATISKLLNYKNQYLLLMTGNRDQILLTAWDGLQWSESRQQSEMFQTYDADSRTILTLTNQQISIDSDGLLNLVASDLERKDIWWKERQMEDIGDWFQAGSLWKPIETINSSNIRFTSIATTTDSAGWVHVFWNLAGDETLELPGNTIYYSRWENQRVWSSRIAVQRSINNYVDQLSVTIDPATNKLLLVWRDGLEGEIYFSAVPANQAAIASSWTPPIKISSPSQICDSPSIMVDPKGVIVVVYAVPINEGRGIYLTTSSDGGLTWSEPVKILDGANLGIEMMNDPQLSIGSDLQYHLLWKHYKFNANRLQPVEMYYGRSTDQGKTWVEISQISNLPVFWSEILVSPNSTLHRFWQELNNDQVEVWHEYSFTNGQSWERVKPFSFFGVKIGSPTVSEDSSGRIHLLQILKPGENLYTLQYLIWENNWVDRQAKDISIDSISALGSPNALVTENGYLGVIIPVEIFNSTVNQPEYRLIFTGQTLDDLPLIETPDSSVPTSNDYLSIPNEPVSPTEENAPPMVETTKPINVTPTTSLSPTTGILIGMFFSILVIAGVFVFRLLNKLNT
mgnify:FL=1